MCEPMYPAPPLTRTRIPSTVGGGGASAPDERWCRVAIGDVPSSRVMWCRERVIGVGKHSAERRSAMPLLFATAAVVGIAVIAFVVVRLLGGSAGSSAAASSPLGIVTTTSAPATTSASSTTGSTADAQPPAATTAATPTVSSADVAVKGALQACVDRQAAAKAPARLHRDRGEPLERPRSGRERPRVAGPARSSRSRRTRGDRPGPPGLPTSRVPGRHGRLHRRPGLPDHAPRSRPRPTSRPRCRPAPPASRRSTPSSATGPRSWATGAPTCREMADHADGHIDSAQAQANWIKRWSEAPVHLTPYKAAAAATPRRRPAPSDLGRARPTAQTLPLVDDPAGLADRPLDPARPAHLDPAGRADPVLDPGHEPGGERARSASAISTWVSTTHGQLVEPVGPARARTGSRARAPARRAPAPRSASGRR